MYTMQEMMIGPYEKDRIHVDVKTLNDPQGLLTSESSRLPVPVHMFPTFQEVMQPRSTTTQSADRRKGKKKKVGRQRIAADMVNDGFASQTSQGYGYSQLSQNGNWSQITDNISQIGNWSQGLSKFFCTVTFK